MHLNHSTLLVEFISNWAFIEIFQLLQTVHWLNSSISVYYFEPSLLVAAYKSLQHTIYICMWALLAGLTHVSYASQIPSPFFYTIDHEQVKLVSFSFCLICSSTLVKDMFSSQASASFRKTIAVWLYQCIFLAKQNDSGQNKWCRFCRVFSGFYFNTRMRMYEIVACRI